MLNGINPIISPELLKTLCEMGHSDCILFSDGNFPASSYGLPVIRMDGVGIPELLDAILPLFPLDTFVSHPVSLMQPNSDFGRDPSVWAAYKSAIQKYSPDTEIAYIERFKFYESCKKVYAIVATTERELYANIIIQKGVIT